MNDVERRLRPDLAAAYRLAAEGLPFSGREWPALLRRLDRASPGYRD